LVSFDVVVWDSDDPMTDEQASAYVRSIYDQADADPAEHIDDRSGRILSFFAECTNRWPGESETSPWASWPIELTMQAVASINLQWSTPEATIKELLSLALANGLTVFDPQGEHVILPPRLLF
jgi:hypothetical protein